MRKIFDKTRPKSLLSTTLGFNKCASHWERPMTARLKCVIWCIELINDINHISSAIVLRTRSLSRVRFTIICSCQMVVVFRTMWLWESTPYLSCYEGFKEVRLRDVEPRSSAKEGRFSWGSCTESLLRFESEASACLAVTYSLTLDSMPEFCMAAFIKGWICFK